MRQEEAKRAILNLWRTKKEPWKKGDHTAFYQSAMAFYCWLEDDCSELLGFRCKDEKWQVIKGWINEYERYPDC